MSDVYKTLRCAVCGVLQFLCGRLRRNKDTDIKHLLPLVKYSRNARLNIYLVQARILRYFYPWNLGGIFREFIRIFVVTIEVVTTHFEIMGGKFGIFYRTYAKFCF